MLITGGGSGGNPDPGDPDPPIDPPPGTGNYTCPFAIWSLEEVYEPPTSDRPWPIYSAVELQPRKFDVSLDDLLGNTDWRDWDSRLRYNTFRGCRGNGYIDLDATYLATDQAMLDQKYDIRTGKKPGAFGRVERFIYLKSINAYCSLSDIAAYHADGVIVGFWRDPSSGGAIPFDFTVFDKTKCPIQAVIVVPRA